MDAIAQGRDPGGFNLIFNLLPVRRGKDKRDPLSALPPRSQVQCEGGHRLPNSKWGALASAK